jgi:hypothetical protein
MPFTLGDRLVERDRERFIGRSRELAALEELLADDAPVNVAYVHGPGGIGKTRLLRELARRGTELGWLPLTVDGRDLPPVPEALEEAVAPLLEAERPLLLIDTFERMSPAADHLRDDVLPRLPGRAAIVIAGRDAPDRGWFENGWEALVRVLALDPLADGDALELARSAGLADARAREVVSWARGLPLALTVGADAARDPHQRLDESPVLSTIVGHVVEMELDGAWSRALAAAAIARVVTVDLLRDVLADGTEADAYAWLASRSFVEPHGDGLGLHALVGRAVSADLRRTDPELERDLRRRIVDHLYARASAGELRLAIDLAHVVEDPILRWGMSWDGSDRFRMDRLRPDDVPIVEEAVRLRLHADWWEQTRRLAEQAPGNVVVARGADGRPSGVAVFVTPASAPAAADDDPLLGPWLAHARSLDDPRTVLWRDAIDFSGDPGAQVQAMLGMVGILRSGLSNVRRVYLPISTLREGAIAFAQALRAERIPELDAVTCGHPMQCWVTDYGPGGLIGTQRDWVYREIGLPVPPTRPPAPPREAVPVDLVRDALRAFNVPVELAQSALAEGDGVEARADVVRERLLAAVARAFGPTADDELLRSVLTTGYLDPAVSHEQAADTLHLSRSAYFRRLRVAVERVTAAL